MAKSKQINVFLKKIYHNSKIHTKNLKQIGVGSLLSTAILTSPVYANQDDNIDFFYEPGVRSIFEASNNKKKPLDAIIESKIDLAFSAIENEQFNFEEASLDFFSKFNTNINKSAPFSNNRANLLSLSKNIDNTINNLEANKKNLTNILNQAADNSYELSSYRVRVVNLVGILHGENVYYNGKNKTKNIKKTA